MTCHQYGISALFRSLLRRHFAWKPVGWCCEMSAVLWGLLSHHTERKGKSVKFLAQNQFGRRVRVQLENCEYLWKFSRYNFSFCYYIKIVTTLKPFFKRNWKQFSAGLRVYNTSSFLLYFRPSSFDCVDIDADCLYSRWWNTWICSWRLVSKQGAFFDRHKLETFGHSKQALLN